MQQEVISSTVVEKCLTGSNRNCKEAMRLEKLCKSTDLNLGAEREEAEADVSECEDGARWAPIA